MPHYEVLFETGRMSVLNCADDEEVKLFITEQQRRAEHGEPGGPIGQPAERIARVYVYDKHPDDYNVEQTASADVLKTEVANLVDQLSDENGVVDISRLAEAVRGLSHPMVNAREAAFDSMYKMKEQKQLDLGFLTGKAGK